MKKFFKYLVYAIGMVAFMLYFLAVTDGQIEEREENYRQEAIENGVHNMNIDE